MGSSMAGSALIALAAILWATDTPFRLPITQKLDPTVIVFYEHLFAVVLLTIWGLARARKELFSLKWAEWLGAFFVGAGGSAVATIFFTASFRYVNPSVAILLQKLQPILVVIFAAAFLKEHPERKFYGWAALALVAATFLSLPDLSFLSSGVDLRSKGVIFALGAASLWAISTVIGKALLNRQPFGVVTFWRYAFGLLGLITILALGHAGPGDALPGSLDTLQSLLYLSLVPGLLALLAYYSGLSRTSASVATFVELLYPVAAVLINAYFLGLSLSPVQMGAGMLLLFAVTQI